MLIFIMDVIHYVFLLIFTLYNPSLSIGLLHLWACKISEGVNKKLTFIGNEDPKANWLNAYKIGLRKVLIKSYNLFCPKIE
jgi:hypothetical protein